MSKRNAAQSNVGDRCSSGVFCVKGSERRAQPGPRRLSAPGQMILWSAALLGQPSDALHRSDAKRVARLSVSASEGADRHLNDCKAAKGRRPCAKAACLPQLEHTPVFRDESHVDGEAHEEGVDGVAGGDDERAAFSHKVVLEQASSPAGRVERGQQRRRQHAIVSGVRERERRGVRSEDGVEERFQATTRFSAGYSCTPPSSEGRREPACQAGLQAVGSADRRRSSRSSSDR